MTRSVTHHSSRPVERTPQSPRELARALRISHGARRSRRPPISPRDRIGPMIVLRSNPCVSEFRCALVDREAASLR